MITVSNYNQEIKNIDLSKLPKNVQEAKTGIEEIMEFYNDDDGIKETIDLYLKAINKVVVSNTQKRKPGLTQKQVKAKKDKLVNAMDLSDLDEPSNYKGLKVEIREVPVNYIKGKYFIWDIAAKMIFANEYFKTKEGAKKFIKQNKMILVEKPETKPQRKSTRTQIASLPFVKLFTPPHQLKALMQTNSEELDDVLKGLEASLKAIPLKPQGENIMNSTVYAHYFYGGSDWYILDYSKSKGLFFGYVVLNGDTQMSEAGYVSPGELKETNKVELDFYFTPKKLSDILTKKYPGEFPNLEKPEKQKPVAKAPVKKVAKKIDVKMVDNYSKEFMLIRRFYNLQKKERATFRQIQLLYMAFQKAIVSREVRKTSDVADLFTKVNKKIVAVFDLVKEGELAADIQVQDKGLVNEIESYVTGSKLNYAISILKSFIAMQNTKPPLDKAKRLLKRMENAIKNNKVESGNRLFDALKLTKSELDSYIKNPKEEIEPTAWGLSYPKRSLCTNRIKCDGLKQNGQLKKGFKFTKGGEIVKVRATKKKPIVKKKAKEKIKKLGSIYIESNTPTPAVSANEGVVTAVPLDVIPQQNTNIEPVIQKAPQETPQETPKTTGKQVKNKLMSMTFDSLEMDEGWENFMQNPAANMKIAIWGKPKNGKTSGALKFAKYLTKKGSVLYNFADQGFNKSTQDLWLNSGLANISNAEPSDIDNLNALEAEIKRGKYKFVFIDMINDYINKDNISPQDFKDRFIKKFPNTSFILVFEVTKGGNFKGDQGWTHVVDAIVTVDSFLMENRGRYGVGHHVIWEEGLKRFNPKKYDEINGLDDNIELPQSMVV